MAIHTALRRCSAFGMLEFFWDHNSDSQIPKVPPDYNKHLHTLEFPALEINLDDLLNNSASFSQIPITVILERIQRGNNLIQDLSKIFHVIIFLSLLAFILLFIYLIESFRT
jgi:hypothetical protein